MILDLFFQTIQKLGVEMENQCFFPIKNPQLKIIETC